MQFELETLDYGHGYEMHSGPSGLVTFGSQSQRVEQSMLEPSDWDFDSLCYTITWKLQLRKGRMVKYTEDTIENIEDTPGTYWKENLEQELTNLVKTNLPEPDYQPEETRISVSTSKRNERDFQKRFNELDIDWLVVENKLRSWSNQGHNLTVTVVFIYKENEQVITNKPRKTGRSATKRQLAERDRIVAEQEASGTRSVWKEVYELFDCSSTACTNRDFSCWKDPVSKKHYKVDSNIMDKLINYAEEGNKLENHDDVPEGLRELIRKHEEDEEKRRQLKRKASDSLPVIHICCSGHHKGSADCSVERKLSFKFPMAKDEAPKAYCNWLCVQVTNQVWKRGYQLACKVTIDNGYDLEHLYNAQSVSAEMLITHGVLPGIALQFVGRVKEWLDTVNVI